MIQEALLQDIPGPFELEVSVYTHGEYGFTSFILLTLKNIHLKMSAQKVSEYDQEIPQSHTADQSTAP